MTSTGMQAVVIRSGPPVSAQSGRLHWRCVTVRLSEKLSRRVPLSEARRELERGARKPRRLATVTHQAFSRSASPSAYGMTWTSATGAGRSALDSHTRW